MVVKKDTVRYPWKRWLSRRKITLQRSKDYNCQPHAMAQQCRNAAAKAGIKLSIHINDNTLTLVRKD